MQDFLVSGLRTLVEKTAAKFDPALLSGLTAAQAIEEWARIEKIACAQKLRAATRAEEVGLDGEGMVAGSSGVPAGTARRQTRAARKAKGKTKEAFEKGDLSATQAGAIADAVEANPAAENDLLDLAASAPTNELLTECERVKRAAIDDAELAARQRRARFVRGWNDELGMARMNAAFEPLVGAKAMAEMERRADRIFREQSRAGGPIDSHEQRLADAFASIIDDAISGAGAKRRGPRTVVRLIVSKDAAERGFVQEGEKCETADGTQVPMTAVYEEFLKNDTAVQEVAFTGIDTATIKTMSRYIPKPLRDLLEAQGTKCHVCGSTKGLQIDHTQERRHGGPTAGFNLKYLCQYCHKLKTSGLYDLVRNEDGKLEWVSTTLARARGPG